MGFGISELTGRRRIPAPPAIMIAFMPHFLSDNAFPHYYFLSRTN